MLAILTVLGAACGDEAESNTTGTTGSDAVDTTNHPDTSVAENDGTVTMAVTIGIRGVSDACFDIEVRDGRGELVWAKGDKATASPTVAAAAAEGAACASAVGDPPIVALGLAGFCHSAAPEHTATIWIDNVFASAAAPLTTWANPCPPGGAGCSIAFSCSEVVHASVAFDLLVVRDGNQGFFDGAAAFADDIFCSLRVDTCLKGSGDDLLQLFVNGARAKTAMLAFTCVGAEQSNLALLADDLVVTCAGQTYVLPPHGPLGNREAPSGGGVAAWATYWGAEELAAATGTRKKLYWNEAIAVDPQAPGGAGADCVLTGQLSVEDTADPNLTFTSTGSGWTTPAGRAYPVFDLAVHLTSATGWFDQDANAANGICQNVTVFDDAVGSQITPIFTDPVTPRAFCSRMDGVAATRGCP